MSEIAELWRGAVCCEIENVRCCDYVARLQPEYIAVSEFVPRILFSAKGVTADIVEDAIKQAAIEFSKATRVLKRWYQINPQRGVRDYYLTNPNTESVHYIDKLWVDECCVDVRREIDCQYEYGYGKFRFNPPNQIQFDRMPEDCNIGCSLTVLAHVSPVERCCEVDKILFDRYRNAIEYGALSRLYEIPNREWSSAPMADRMYQRFRIEVDKAMADVNRHYASGQESLITGGVY